MSSNQPRSRPNLREIARTTLNALELGTYTLDDSTYNLRTSIDKSKRDTTYFEPDSILSTWPSLPPPNTLVPIRQTMISIVENSTLEGARLISRFDLSNPADHGRIGVLNFASAKNPGGGFINGAQAQEESLARSSTLYPSLMTSTAQQFYQLHKWDPKDGYYSHSMVYAPNILLIRSDNGDWQLPLEVDILVSAAVNAGVVRRKLREIGSTDESELEAAMKERMARILFLFERQGVEKLVLGSFGTGVFRNHVAAIARIWAKLLYGEGARFKNSFSHIMFAIIDHKTYEEFKDCFEQYETEK